MIVVLGGHASEYVMEHGILFIVPLYGIDGVIGGVWWWDCRRHGSDKAGPPAKHMLGVANITTVPHAAGDRLLVMPAASQRSLLGTARHSYAGGKEQQLRATWGPGQLAVVMPTQYFFGMTTAAIQQLSLKVPAHHSQPEPVPSRPTGAPCSRCRLQLGVRWCETHPTEQRGQPHAEIHSLRGQHETDVVIVRSDDHEFALMPNVQGGPLWAPAGQGLRVHHEQAPLAPRVLFCDAEVGVVMVMRRGCGSVKLSLPPRAAAL